MAMAAISPSGWTSSSSCDDGGSVCWRWITGATGSAPGRPASRASTATPRPRCASSCAGSGAPASPSSTGAARLDRRSRRRASRSSVPTRSCSRVRCRTHARWCAATRCCCSSAISRPTRSRRRNSSPATTGRSSSFTAMPTASSPTARVSRCSRTREQRKACSSRFPARTTTICMWSGPTWYWQAIDRFVAALGTKRE